MNFTEKLKRLTVDRNLAKVGRRAGLGPTAIANYIRKGSIPRADIALRIARSLGVSPEWLVDDSQGWPPAYVSADDPSAALPEHATAA